MTVSSSKSRNDRVIVSILWWLVLVTWLFYWGFSGGAPYPIVPVHDFVFSLVHGAQFEVKNRIEALAGALEWSLLYSWPILLWPVRQRILVVISIVYVFFSTAGSLQSIAESANPGAVVLPFFNLAIHALYIGSMFVAQFLRTRYASGARIPAIALTCLLAVLTLGVFESFRSVAQRVSILTDDVAAFDEHSIWAAQNIGAIASGVNDELMPQLREPATVQAVLSRYDRASWQKACDQLSANSTGDPLGRSDRAECVAAGALHFADAALCLALPQLDMNNEPHTGRPGLPKLFLATACLAELAARSGSAEFCSRDPNGSDRCAAVAQEIATEKRCERDPDERAECGKVKTSLWILKHLRF